MFRRHMIDLASEKAKEVLKGNLREKGVIAGRQYYPDVWGRDGFISSLGMSLSKDSDLLKASKLMINSLATYQRESGQLPNKISADGKKICFGEGGCVDSSLWYPIAVWNYYYVTNDKAFLKQHIERIEKAVRWAMNLDQNGDFLIEINEGADWMDLLLRAGRVLYDEVLYYAALVFTDKIRKELGKDEAYSSIAAKVKENINLFFWPKEENLEKIVGEYGYTGIENDFKTALLKGEKDYYFAEIRFREADDRCDVYANCLAIIFDIADDQKKERIFQHFDKEKVYEPYPIKALWPPIRKEDPNWILHFRWTTIPHFIIPGNHHNGGIWPYIGGFYIVALVKEGKMKKARIMLEKLAEANLKTDFNEWLDQEGKPGGSSFQSWSAAMYLFAYEAVEEEIFPLQV